MDSLLRYLRLFFLDTESLKYHSIAARLKGRLPGGPRLTDEPLTLGYVRICWSALHFGGVIPRA